MYKTTESLVELILSVIDPEYPKRGSSDKVLENEHILKRAIFLAKRNGVGYIFLKNLKEISNSPIVEREYKLEEDNLKKFKRTLKILNHISETYGIPFVLIKDSHFIPHVPRDVDIFIRLEDKDNLIRAFETEGVTCDQSGKIETTVLSTNTLPVDIYTKIIYFGKEFIDEDLLLNSIEMYKTFGIEYLGLNNEVSFMLDSLHSLFGHKTITLLDFLQLKEMKKELDTDFCRYYTKSKGWEGVFALIYNRLSSLEEEIYKKRKPPKFPYKFDTKFVTGCIKQIEGLNLDTVDKAKVYLSLIIDDAKLMVEYSRAYEYIKKIKPLRKILLQIAYKSRELRKDKYS